MSTTIEYLHRAGYGRDDHMADEIIARAARHLGLDGASAYVLASVGFTSHAVPMGAARVSLPSGPGVRRQMERALRRARAEVRCRDCCIEVVTVRRRREAADEGWVEVDEHRQGTRWVPVSIEAIEVDVRS